MACRGLNGVDGRNGRQGIRGASKLKIVLAVTGNVRLPADSQYTASYKPRHFVIDTRHQSKWTPPERNGRRKSIDFSSHVEDCRKRAHTPLAAESGMHADIPAGKDLGSLLLAEPVPI